jgi:protein subunit release factor A
MKDDRVTDHRLNENVYGVEGLLEGGEQLDDLIDMLLTESRRERLLEIIQKLD